MVTLYNVGCKFPVKEMEKSELRLLVIEDEKKLCDMIAKSLHMAGYEVDMCNDGERALDMIYTERYDLIVLDLNLPGLDGMEILRELRKENEETKVLIVSARSQIADKVEGLDSGANDYMEKPFHLQELEARVRSLTRRKFVQKNICLECGKLRFDTRERVAFFRYFTFVKSPSVISKYGTPSLKTYIECSISVFSKFLRSRSASSTGVCLCVLSYT